MTETKKRVKRTVVCEIAWRKRRYRKILTELAAEIKAELDGFGDDIFAPSHSIVSTAHDLIVESSKLSALLDIEE
jgi:hypothetical protein